MPFLLLKVCHWHSVCPLKNTAHTSLNTWCWEDYRHSRKTILGDNAHFHVIKVLALMYFVTPRFICSHCCVRITYVTRLLIARLGNVGETSKSKLDFGSIRATPPKHMNAHCLTAAGGWVHESVEERSAVHPYHHYLKTLTVTLHKCKQPTWLLLVLIASFFRPFNSLSSRHRRKAIPYQCWLWFDFLLYPTSFWS